VSKSADNECLVLNIDYSNNNGCHWICLFMQNGELYYFDSYSFAPPLEVLDYYKAKNRWSDSCKIQYYDDLIKVIILLYIIILS
jgi:hypothetical protein